MILKSITTVKQILLTIFIWNSVLREKKLHEYLISVLIYLSDHPLRMQSIRWELAR